MSVKPIFAWYDMWVGFFWDQAKRRLYIFPVPMLGVAIQFAASRPRCRSGHRRTFNPSPGNPEMTVSNSLPDRMEKLGGEGALNK